MKGSEPNHQRCLDKKDLGISLPERNLSAKSSKKTVIYNIRPSTWYSEEQNLNLFSSLEDFLALNETLLPIPTNKAYQWTLAQKCFENYEEHTGIKLQVHNVNFG